MKALLQLLAHTFGLEYGVKDFLIRLPFAIFIGSVSTAIVMLIFINIDPIELYLQLFCR